MHNSAAVTSSLQKLLLRWRPSEDLWPEEDMMKRLGFTAEELKAYREEALTAETYT